MTTAAAQAKYVAETLGVVDGCASGVSSAGRASNRCRWKDSGHNWMMARGTSYLHLEEARSSGYAHFVTTPTSSISLLGGVGSTRGRGWRGNTKLRTLRLNCTYLPSHGPSHSQLCSPPSSPLLIRSFPRYSDNGSNLR